MRRGLDDCILQHFLDRYNRIGRIIGRRIKASKIRNVMAGDHQDEHSFIGMVTSIRRTKKDNLFVELEDPTGSIRAVITKNTVSNNGDFPTIVPDEVIGVVGHWHSSSSTGRGRYFLVDRVIFPDISLYERRKKESRVRKAHNIVMISDTHFGSRTFIENSWRRFIEWVIDEWKENHIKDIIVAGDIVDGIGVYPSQERDLLIDDIYEQYELAASYFNEMPSEINIFISPGNHDAVRQAEPQPPLPADIASMFSSNCRFLRNPDELEIEGKKILIYHGQSFDDFVTNVSWATYSQPERMMEEMLRKRHLAPIYGKNVPIVAENRKGYIRDYAVIEEVPDIFVCGHSHTVGISSYRGVLCVNSGTWQAQTSYQRKRNIVPETCYATMVDLSTMKTRVIHY